MVNKKAYKVPCSLMTCLSQHRNSSTHCAERPWCEEVNGLNKHQVLLWPGFNLISVKTIILTFKFFAVAIQAKQNQKCSTETRFKSFKADHQRVTKMHYYFFIIWSIASISGGSSKSCGMTVNHWWKWVVNVPFT